MHHCGSSAAVPGDADFSRHLGECGLQSRAGTESNGLGTSAASHEAPELHAQLARQYALDANCGVRAPWSGSDARRPARRVGCAAESGHASTQEWMGAQQPGCTRCPTTPPWAILESESHGVGVRVRSFQPVSANAVSVYYRKHGVRLTQLLAM